MKQSQWVDPFLILVQQFQEGKLKEMKDYYNQLLIVDKARISLQCIDQNIYGLNATVRIKIASLLLSDKAING